MDIIEIEEGAQLSAEDEKLQKIIQEIIGLERRYYFEKKNVKSERQRKVKEIIERHSSSEEA